MKLISKNFQKKIAFLVTLLLIVVFVSAFFVGNLAYKYAAYCSKLRGANYAVGLVRKGTKGTKSKPQFFYPVPKQGPSEIFQKEEVIYPFTFIVYGDSREPAGYEKDAIIARIIEEKPAFVIQLGDMVLYGEEHQWKIFDFFDGKIMDSGIIFYPVLGNHEYQSRSGHHSSNPEEQLKHYFNRFAFLENRRWYSFKYGNSLFLVLDTNTDYSPESHQYKWLMNKLKGETTDFLFVAFHHPPYTKNISYSRRKSEEFLADILESYNEEGLIKADIVFSGHVHNYERYKHNGIYYVVSGGGGAPQYLIDRDPDDFYTKTGYTFHYCKITVSETKLTFEMINLDKDTGDWVVADTFAISKETKNRPVGR